MAENNQENLKVSAGGVSLAVKGREIIAIIALLGLGVGVYFSHLQNIKDHQTVVDELQVMTYIMSLPADSRPKIIPPPSLRNRLQDPNWFRDLESKGRR